MTGSENSLAPRDKTSGRTPAPVARRQKSANAAADQSEPSTRRLRLLVPIDATEESRWALRYAVELQKKGTAVEVILLNVCEPVTQWQVLRFRTQQEVSEFQSARADAFIDESCGVLEAENIPCRGLFKQGRLAFTILDTAEEMECDEIVIPSPPRGITGFFSHSSSSAVLAGQRAIPVVTVDHTGHPAR